MEPHRRKLRAGIFALIWALAIFVSSCFFISADEFITLMRHVLPGASLRQAFATFWYQYGFFVVKGWHATEYAILMSVAYLWLRRMIPPPRALFVALLFSILFAASDEWHQTFVPYRDGCLRDVIIDSAGATLAAIFWVIKLRGVSRIKTAPLPQ